MAKHYGSIGGFQTYHEERNHQLSAELMSDDDAISGALIVASEWIDARFRERFPGLKTGGREQEREWPRQGAIDVHGAAVGIQVPIEIERATYEAAALVGTTPGVLSVNWTPNKYQSDSVSGAVSVTYGAISSVEEAQTQFAIINEILSTLIRPAPRNDSYVGSSIRA